MPIPATDLARLFEKDLDRILRLYAEDEVFAEICRDYVSVARLKSEGSPALPDILDSLRGLEEEIRQRLDAEAGNTSPMPLPRRET
ncbi:hypothetical protein [Aliiruegeria lutimaris]|uniref:Uncharacterized protein n=1 Tax=Aliiruegeria lutimaris TaxID=571298 RepID=A0A1G9MRQ1_9RHOB|nr:hypothetical protein [Aliiruegeria lutimaris]SDL76774.1 hypothetical protein SAMN04488026_11135 [Aliiruegeria lutimaris]